MMNILVTGASGFIGGHFARVALQQGYRVRISARRSEAVSELIAAGAEYLPGDIGNAQRALHLCRDIEAVVHCAGAVGVWGSYQSFHHGNVTLTENMIAACLKQNVRRFVHLSSPSIYFDGRAHVAIREEQVPQHFANAYGRTKFLAEQQVFAAQQRGLEVLALRPRFVTGAGDTSIFPRMIAMQKAGRLAIVGKGLNRVDFTSIDNLNQALLSALQVGDSALGRAYNISNGQPVPLWDVVNYVMRRLELPQVKRRIPYTAAYTAACINEALCYVLPGRPEPKLLRLGVAVMAKDFSLDISRAKQYLAYEPNAPLWGALDQFCQWWQAR